MVKGKKISKSNVRGSRRTDVDNLSTSPSQRSFNTINIKQLGKNQVIDEVSRKIYSKLQGYKDLRFHDSYEAQP